MPRNAFYVLLGIVAVVAVGFLWIVNAQDDLSRPTASFPGGQSTTGDRGTTPPQNQYDRGGSATTGGSTGTGGATTQPPPAENSK